MHAHGDVQRAHPHVGRRRSAPGHFPGRGPCRRQSLPGRRRRPTGRADGRSWDAQESRCGQIRWPTTHLSQKRLDMGLNVVKGEHCVHQSTPRAAISARDERVRQVVAVSRMSGAPPGPGGSAQSPAGRAACPPSPRTYCSSLAGVALQTMMRFRSKCSSKERTAQRPWAQPRTPRVLAPCGPGAWRPPPRGRRRWHIGDGGWRPEWRRAYRCPSG